MDDDNTITIDAINRRLRTYPETMALLGGIRKNLLFNLIEAGEIVRVRIGRRSFIAQASIDAYVDRLIANAS